MNTYFTLQQVKDIETVHRDILNTQDYVGQQLFKTDQTSGRVHHFGKVPKTSPWYNVPLIEPFVPFLGGGEIYILSKKSLKVIVSDKLRYIKNCYEDRMIGSILHDHDIHPYQLDLKIKTWSINNIIGKIVSLNAPPFIIEETKTSVLPMDKQIMIKPKEKTVIGMMKKI